MPSRISAWLYDGEPDQVEQRITAAALHEGGYVVAMELSSGTLKLAATRHPAKYVSAWQLNVRRYGLPEVRRVLVSPPCLRYLALKRGLAQSLAGQRDRASNDFRVAIDLLTEKAGAMFAASGV